MHGRIYLDNAATSFPKPPAVLRAMMEYSLEIGASPGRGAYAESRRGAGILGRCRERLCELFGGRSPEHVIFTLNCSDALNLAIHGIVKGVRRRSPGAPVHVVTSAMDHNSVLRPLNDLAHEGVECTRVRASGEGRVEPADVERAIRPETRLVTLVHASNVTGTIQDVAAVGEICRRRGVPFLVDAAQSLGHAPLDVEAMGIDLLAFPGHKGLLGPLGTGGLYIRPELEALLEPVRQGGTGSRSESDAQPRELPDRYESGSHNTVGIAGLMAGVEWLLGRGVARVRAHELALAEQFLESMRGISGFRVLGPRALAHRVGVFSLVHESLGPTAVAAELERRAGVLARAGLHCAPGAHESIGAISRGGACRLSLGPFVTPEQLEAACACLREIGRDAPGLCHPEGLGSSIHPASV
ncbi:MAG TPA: aminotransferase class V-fold PLP-dependent enzyme [Phycisphaerales bacterium]|nr:aminotransferase class V-fold PLP-dependent enzyme [Phycisphaerales bacterium]